MEQILRTVPFTDLLCDVLHTVTDDEILVLSGVDVDSGVKQSLVGENLNSTVW